MLPTLHLFDFQGQRQKIPQRKKFSDSEDQQLRCLVATFGTKNWDCVALYMPGRTGRQCRDRYRNYLVPGLFNGEWTKEEDKLLYYKHKEFGPAWSRIASFFNGRSPNTIKNRWNYFVSHMKPEELQKETEENLSIQKKAAENVDEGIIVEAWNLFDETSFSNSNWEIDLSSSDIVFDFS